MIHRIDVRTTPLARGGAAAVDPVGEAVRQQIREFGTAVGPIETTRIFLIDSDASAAQVARAAAGLLADPVIESAEVTGAADAGSRIEIHLKPGVMDPVAASTETALRDLGLDVRQVRTGRAYLLADTLGQDELRLIAARVLANGVIESVHFDRHVPERFETGRVEPFKLGHVAVRDLSDEQLKRLSRDGHLFLSLDEMRAVQGYFRKAGREPTDVELETIAQTWSEHCVHKTLKSAVDVEQRDADGRVVGTRRYGNLIKETIFGSTVELMAKEDPASPFCLSVFKDNAGVIAFDEVDAVCFKAETHNHPSAIEPYGGSATGVGGVIRDVLGTGLGAKPIANTDVFCVANATQAALPRGVIHPKRVLQQIVAGVRDYGNRMGIPTVNGAVYFDDRYVGNPLVFCGCVGVIPRDKVEKAVGHGDKIVVLGGRTGRDGIHGATFSSAELTDTHADEFSHAVQIGNAITEKKVADVILQARDAGLFTGVTDCGAGGLSSAVGEMGEKTGAVVELGAVPLKYAGLRYDEIWISEAQERMVLSVPADRVEALLALAGGEDVEATVIGTFGTPGRELVLNYNGAEVGRMGMAFLHDGIPMPTRKAVVLRRDTGLRPVPAVADGNGTLAAPSKRATHGPEARVTGAHDFRDRLLKTLAHPNIASKHWIIRQYDHEVQGGSVVKPLVGPRQVGPSDAAVVRPKLGSDRGVAIGCGLTPSVLDPYDMAIAAIDEAVRNVVCVGADYNRLALLDNFCWPSVDDELTMGTLVRACEACRDAARAFGIPFISGKDSLHNQFTDTETGNVIRIPPTLLISAIGIVPDVRRCVTMDFKSRGRPVCLVVTRRARDLASLAATHQKMAEWIAAGHVAACHDVSDGGYAVTLAEMAIASGIGVTLDPDLFAGRDPFAELPGQYVIQVADIDPDFEGKLAEHFGNGVDVVRLGWTQHAPELMLFNSRFRESGEKVEMIPIDKLAAAWRGTLDW
jgi:phosphoribosylformylglycinamidine (FGAM) synthase-like enzyme/phosphoribosylformylglycinamidine (FGAM) synthase PurS component